MMRFGGLTNPRSGAGPTRKNDGRTARNSGNELIEFKRTDNKRQITLKVTDLRDLEYHAIAEGRVPVLQFEIDGRRYVVLTEGDYFDCVRLRRAGDVLQTPDQSSAVVRPRKMPVHRDNREQHLLQRVPGERRNRAGQGSLSGYRVRGRQRVRGKAPVSQVRSGERRAAGSMGRNLGARAASTPEEDAS